MAAWFSIVSYGLFNRFPTERYLDFQFFAFTDAMAINSPVQRLFRICGVLSSWSLPFCLCSGGLYLGEKSVVRFLNSALFAL